MRSWTWCEECWEWSKKGTPDTAQRAPLQTETSKAAATAQSPHRASGTQTSLRLEVKGQVPQIVGHLSASNSWSVKGGFACGAGVAEDERSESVATPAPQASRDGVSLRAMKNSLPCNVGI